MKTRQIGRREAMAVMGRRRGRGARLRRFSGEPVIHDDHDHAGHQHQRGLRGDADRNDWPVSVADRLVQERMSNAADGIFADSLSSEIVTPTGSPTTGYSVAFQVGI